MEVSAQQIRGFRLRAHHLEEKLPAGRLAEAAGACGLQNTPPGAWETALYSRVEGCTLQGLQDALYREKTLLQAWSFRGAPVVFPAEDAGVFLTPLAAREGEEPWIYTLGLTGALDWLGMPFGDLLARVQEAARCLDGLTVQGKEALDRTLADLVCGGLPEEKRGLWRAPSLYGDPGRQTMGEAAVSFLLRPCSFSSLVVFGERQGATPSFTSFRSWMGRDPEGRPDGERELVRRFLHCYGPAAPDHFRNWLGCSPRQARRLWEGVSEEAVRVEAGGKPLTLLAADLPALRDADSGGGRMLLLGPHDPYLDVRDREVLLEDRALHKAVWRFSGNPGAVLQEGRITGIWRARTQGEKLRAAVRLWEPARAAGKRELERLLEEYAAFRGLRLQAVDMEGAN